MLDAQAASQVISQIEPRIVIPMYFKIPGLKINLDSVSRFSQEFGVKEDATMDKLKINKKDLPQEETKIIILRPQV